MAKFLRYGLAKGLSVRHDFNADMERATQREEIARQARQEYEQKAKYYAERLKKGVPFSEVGRKRLEPEYEKIFSEIGRIPLTDPNWETSIEGQRKFNDLSDQILNNPILIEDATARKQYEAFLADANEGLLTTSQIENEVNKWDAYNLQDPTDTKPVYTYRRPPEFNMIEDINIAVESLLKAPDKELLTSVNLGIYGERIYYDPGRIEAVAKGHYTANAEGYDVAWDNVDAKQKEVFYQNDIVKFISDLIIARLPKESTNVKAYPSRFLSGGAGRAGGEKDIRPYMRNVFGKDGSTNDPHIWSLIPAFKKGDDLFLDTTTIRGIKLSDKFDDENAEFSLLNGINTPIMISKTGGAWKKDKSGMMWAKTELMMPSGAYRRYVGSQISGMVGLNEREVNLNPAAGKVMSWTNEKGETVTMPLDFMGGGGEKALQTFTQFGTNETKFTMFTAWVPLSTDDSATSAYDQEWKSTYMGTNTMDLLYPQTRTAGREGAVAYDHIEFQKDEFGNTWRYYLDEYNNVVAEPELVK